MSPNSSHLDGVAQCVVGRQLHMPQAFASQRARAVALLDPALYAQPVVRMTGRHDDGVRHKLHGHGAVVARGCV
eukprot:356245-Chlamydomonas_euryale.AAC.2